MASRHRRLVVQAILPLVVMAAWVLILVWQIRQLVDTAKWVEHTDQVLAALHQLEGTVDRHVAAVRGYLLTGDAALLAPYNDAAAFTDAADQVAVLTADNPPQVQRMREVAAAYSRWRAVATEQIAAARARAPDAASVHRAEAIHVQTRSGFAAMRRVEERLRTERTGRAARAQRQTLLVVSIAGAVLAVLLAAGAVRSLTALAADYEQTQQALRDEADKLSAAERQLRADAAGLEDRVRERTRDLERANAQLEAFGYTVSHDLRAPLRGVQGLAQALVEDYGDRLDATGRAYATRVVDEAALMETLIQDLLRYARLSRTGIGIEPVDLDDAMAAALRHVEADAARAGGEITVAPNLGSVRGNRAVLVQVLINLLSNAVKFGGAHPSVLVWSERAGANVRVWVVDHGIGIKPEHHEQIFRVFERLHGADEYPGTGIGLAIVRQALERLDGRFGVESALGEGSRFWIELPGRSAVA
jgi:signal transduction histidine kinase